MKSFCPVTLPATSCWLRTATKVPHLLSPLSFAKGDVPWPPGENWPLDVLIHPPHSSASETRDRGPVGTLLWLEGCPSADPWFSQGCSQNLLRLSSSLPRQVWPFPQSPVTLTACCNSRFHSTGQTESSEKTKDLLEMVKKLQKGHVSSCVCGLAQRGFKTGRCGSISDPSTHNLGKLSHCTFSLLYHFFQPKAQLRNSRRISYSPTHKCMCAYTHTHTQPSISLTHRPAATIFKFSGIFLEI